MQVIGWENIELISDRPLETMLKEFKQLKQEYPDRCELLLHDIGVATQLSCIMTPAWTQVATS